MRYAIARYNQHRRDLAYRIYVTDCLRITAENTAKTVSALTEGRAEVYTVKQRFADIFEEKKKDDRTPEDIIDGIRKKL
jgi:hypothetical protein